MKLSAKNKGYSGRFEFDDEAGIFHGEVCDIKDVITFQAKTLDEINQAFRESIDDYLEFCRSLGEKPEIPSSRRAEKNQKFGAH